MSAKAPVDTPLTSEQIKMARQFQEGLRSDKEFDWNGNQFSPRDPQSAPNSEEPESGVADIRRYDVYAKEGAPNAEVAPKEKELVCVVSYDATSYKFG